MQVGLDGSLICRQHICTAYTRVVSHEGPSTWSHFSSLSHTGILTLLGSSNVLKGSIQTVASIFRTGLSALLSRPSITCVTTAPPVCQVERELTYFVEVWMEVGTPGAF